MSSLPVANTIENNGIVDATNADSTPPTLHSSPQTSTSTSSGNESEEVQSVFSEDEQPKSVKLKLSGYSNEAVDIDKEEESCDISDCGSNVKEKKAKKTVYQQPPRMTIEKPKKSQKSLCTLNKSTRVCLVGYGWKMNAMKTYKDNGKCTGFKKSIDADKDGDIQAYTLEYIDHELMWVMERR